MHYGLRGGWTPLAVKANLFTLCTNYYISEEKSPLWNVFSSKIFRDPLWHRQDGQPKPMSPLLPHLKVECR